MMKVLEEVAYMWGLVTTIPSIRAWKRRMVMEALVFNQATKYISTGVKKGHKWHEEEHVTLTHYYCIQIKEGTLD